MRPSTPTCKRCTCCGEGLVVVNVGYYYVCYSARQSLYNVDAKEVRSYFTYDRTRNGLLRVCSRLFRLRFVDVSDEVVKWHPDVEVFDVCVVSVIPRGCGVCANGRLSLFQVQVVERSSVCYRCWHAAGLRWADVPRHASATRQVRCDCCCVRWALGDSVHWTGHACAADTSTLPASRSLTAWRSVRLLK